MNFTLILFTLVVVSGIIYAIDVLWWAPKRLAKGKAQEKPPMLIDYSRSFFPVLLLVLLLRSFLFEPFRIPSGSLEPTLLIGDFVLVNKFYYGLRWPVWNKKFVSVYKPQIGDIMVFRWPPDDRYDYIKRVVGVPGDHVVYKNKTLTINGKVAKQTDQGLAIESDNQGNTWKVEKRLEDLNGIKHSIYVRPEVPAENFDVVVPKGYYFMMGDNRDDSSDSRYWGFVSEKNIVGKAQMVWMSWNGQTDSIRWSRIGKIIH